MNTGYVKVDAFHSMTLVTFSSKRTGKSRLIRCRTLASYKRLYALLTHMGIVRSAEHSTYPDGMGITYTIRESAT